MGVCVCVCVRVCVCVCVLVQLRLVTDRLTDRWMDRLTWDDGIYNAGTARAVKITHKHNFGTRTYHKIMINWNDY